MKFRPSSIINAARILAFLVLVAICTYHPVLAAIPQMTFVRSTPAPQTQNQQNLPPEKQKSLSKLGPDDIFPGNREQNANPEKPNRPVPKPRPAAKASPSTAVAQTKATPSPTPAPLSEPSPVTAAPAATAASAAITKAADASPMQTQPQSPLLNSPPNPSSRDWQFPGLMVLTLGVFAALIFVLIKLRKMLREDSNAF